MVLFKLCFSDCIWRRYADRPARGVLILDRIKNSTDPQGQCLGSDRANRRTTIASEMHDLSVEFLDRSVQIRELVSTMKTGNLIQKAWETIEL